jgi:hypothetical protein
MCQYHGFSRGLERLANLSLSIDRFVVISIDLKYSGRRGDPMAMLGSKRPYKFDIGELISEDI